MCLITRDRSAQLRPDIQTETGALSSAPTAIRPPNESTAHNSVHNAQILSRSPRIRDPGTRPLTPAQNLARQARPFMVATLDLLVCRDWLFLLTPCFSHSLVSLGELCTSQLLRYIAPDVATTYACK